MNWVAIISVICLFVIAPSIVFTFIYMSKKAKIEVDLLKYKRDMMEIDLEKEKVHLKLIEAENLKYDRIIEDRGKS
jgi:hypothetical protein